MVGTPNTSEVWRGDIDGDTFYVKEQTWNEMAGEAIACLLGRAIGLNVPLGMTWSNSGSDYWLSPEVPFSFHWDRSFLQNARIQDQFGGMVVLDAVIGNWDRHSRNVLLRQKDDLTLEPWFIDHSDSVAGNPGDIKALGLAVHGEMRVPEDFPHEGLDEAVAKYATKLTDNSWLPNRAISRALEAVPSLRDEERATILQCLSARCLQAARISAEYLSKIRRS